MFFIRFNTTDGGFTDTADVTAALTRVSEQLTQGETVGTVRDSRGKSVGSWIYTDQDFYEDDEEIK